MNLGLYFISAVILLSFEVCYLMIANKYNIVDRPHHQSSHSGVVIRGGGVIFYAAFFLWSTINGIPWFGGFVGLTILAIVSFIDDIHSVNPLIRLVCHFISIIFLFFHSGLIQTPLYVIILLAVACVGALNIYNFMDGINGMTGGYSSVVTFALLYANEKVVNFADRDLLVIVIISLIIFSIFNFRKKAVCFAGDVGSLSIGFILIYLILRLALKGQSMSWMAMLIVYMVDGGMTIVHRLLLRENLMKPHKKHAYQIMANELKMPHLAVSGIYMGLQAICSTFYIVYPGYATFIIETIVLVLMYLWFMDKYYHLHVEKHKL